MMGVWDDLWEQGSSKCDFCVRERMGAWLNVYGCSDTGENMPRGEERDYIRIQLIPVDCHKRPARGRF